MINKRLSKIGINQRINEQSFMWMLHSAVFKNNDGDGDGDSDDNITKIIAYWFSIAFNKAITKNDFSNDIIDKIRRELLINAGVKNPRIYDTELWKKIKKLIN